MRTITVSVVVWLFLAGAAGAQVSREELIELVDSGTETSLIVSQIERDCVDFEMDAKAVSELAGTLPRHVIQAAIDCAGPPPESRMCKIYRALTADPRLSDFPVVVTWFRHGNLRLLELSSGTWLDERGVKGFKNRFKAMGEHAERHLAAVAAVKDLDGVRDYLFESDPDLSSAELAAMQRDAVLEECSRRARLKVTSEPTGAFVYVDGRRSGLTPLRLELLPGEHLLEVEAKNFEVYSEQLVLRDGEMRGVDAVLERMGSLEISSDPSDAVIVVDGSFAGHTPAEVFVEGGLHTVRLVHSGRPVHEEEVGVGRGEAVALEVTLEPPVEGHCYETDIAGPISKNWKALAAQLEGVQLRLLVPLYEVVSSTMEREIPSTHVVDARRVLFEPGVGKEFVDDPWKMLGMDLGGLSFGETAVDLLETPAGQVTVTEVERKKTALRLELLDQSGDKNAVFLDFTRALETVEISEVLAALCVVASRDAAAVLPAS